MARVHPHKTPYMASTFTLVSLLVTLAHAVPSANLAAADLQKRYTQTYSGCYSSSDGLTVNVGTYTYQTSSFCGNECTSNGDYAVLGLTGGDDCWCGDEIPPASSLVDDSYCNSNCTGYGTDMCGGDDYWSVYLTGTEANVAQAGASSSTTTSTAAATTTAAAATTAATSATSATSTSSQEVVTSVAPGTTVVVTQSATHPSGKPTGTSSSKSSGGTSTAGVAAGVVVGILAAAALVGGVYFFLRRRRQRQAEEDYKRSTQVSDFMRGGERKPPGTGYSQASDQRLDPDIGGRRNSVGSIADSQDHSRRILRVANPDGTDAN